MTPREVDHLVRLLQVIDALTEEAATANTALMARFHVGAATVRGVRAELELAGVIPRTRRPGLHDTVEFIDDYSFLRDQGISNADIASRFGILPASLERRARRHGCWRPDRECVA